MGGKADVELLEVETDLAISGEASSGLAMRRPPSEPERSRSPFMVETTSSEWGLAPGCISLPSHPSNLVASHGW